MTRRPRARLTLYRVSAQAAATFGAAPVVSRPVLPRPAQVLQTVHAHALMAHTK